MRKVVDGDGRWAIPLGRSEFACFNINKNKSGLSGFWILGKLGVIELTLIREQWQNNGMWRHCKDVTRYWKELAILYENWHPLAMSVRTVWYYSTHQLKHLNIDIIPPNSHNSVILLYPPVRTVKYWSYSTQHFNIGIATNIFDHLNSYENVDVMVRNVYINIDVIKPNNSNYVDFNKPVCTMYVDIMLPSNPINIDLITPKCTVMFYIGVKCFWRENQYVVLIISIFSLNNINISCCRS